jgi:hypothetical protein
MTQESTATPAAKRARKMAREHEGNDQKAPRQAQSEDAHTEPKAPKAPSKTFLILGMMQRSEGATLEQMVAATGWLPHTTRAALTGLRKKGHAIERSRVDGVTHYSVIAAPVQ